jgi:hypothetical protein
MRKCIPFIIVLLSTSCASIYRPINTDKMEYLTFSKVADSVDVSYNYETQLSFKNGKYKNAERRTNYSAVSIKIRNNSSRKIIIKPETFILKIDGKTADVISSDQYASVVRQNTASFLVYGIFGPYIPMNDGVIYTPIFLSIGLLNMGIAAHANTEHKKNIKDLEIWGKSVHPKSNLTGIIFLENYTFDIITFTCIE